MHRSRRSLAIIGLLAALLLLLAACDKPAPRITVQTGSFSTTLRPGVYCFEARTCHSYTDASIPTVRAHPDGKILIDVPREVAYTGWVVRAVPQDGSSGTVSGPIIYKSHSYDLAASVFNGRDFAAEIDQVRNGRADGSRWTFLVEVLPN